MNSLAVTKSATRYRASMSQVFPAAGRAETDIRVRRREIFSIENECRRVLADRRDDVDRVMTSDAMAVRHGSTAQAASRMVRHRAHTQRISNCWVPLLTVLRTTSPCGENLLTGLHTGYKAQGAVREYTAGQASSGTGGV
jgi:hypothetical protein